ncbi:RagB/SusD family nutrient uptake outer membrane protein [Bacteroides sp. 519]|uniref:RagB/SusD family nutrient uptake outer membrane protein n=1 Tax=Bacteroides sp. 519 TaxID=2302937 RepID=UPI0013D54AA6|nr:RagB/SusD family nutrient uptake outer membrane protein [Bacteroides sp. 519]NDV60417.1 RagB/SusD family nutrient uptake outer membrane protein [Bacteroides sp. 519]
MKKQYIFLIAFVAVLFTACDDFLDRQPLSSVTSEHYLNTENELASFGAAQYNALPSHAPGVYSIGTFGTDNNSDNQCSTNVNSNFLPGERRVATNGGWDFKKIRDCNYFFETVLPKYEAGSISGVEANIRHYIGEMYFFRAFQYFSFLKTYGDFPIVEKSLSDNYEELAEANQRRPRNEVARFILSDLDKAIDMMRETAPASNRLTRYVALLLKSRVALYEGTWLKYHAGTDRVPGGPNWPGAKASYLSGFSINIEEEINFFLTEAKQSAEQVAGKFSLGDYASMFNSVDLSGMNEVLLWRKYNTDLKVFHYVVSYLQTLYPGGNGSGNTGFTRSLVETYLMKNGLPIYAAESGYQGDETLTKVVEGRDERLRQSMSVPGDPINPFITFTKPGITIVNENRVTTGYCLRKGLNQDPSMAITLPCYTGSVIFRAGEAYLNYIEAQYLLDGSLDAQSKTFWKALRIRAGVSDDIQGTIDATDLTKENDLAVYSGSQLVDATLYNIRRERRSEFIAEGMRLDDLYRWRALDNMKDYHMEGFNLWDKQYELYDDLKPAGEADEPNVSARDYKYLRPFRVRSNNKAYNGYTFMQAHYLAPIAYDVIRLSTPEKGGDISTAYIYQNPGWKVQSGTGAEK